MRTPPITGHAFHALRRLSVTEARRRPGRILVTIAVIALGATALTVALVLGASVRTAVTAGLTVELSHVDVVDDAGLANAADSVGGGGTSQSFSSADISKIAHLPQVAGIGTVYKVLAAAQAGSITRGVTLESLNTNPEFRWEGWSAGRAPTATGEIGLSHYTLDQLRIRLGDPVAITTPNAGTSLYRVVGVVDTRGSFQWQGSTFGIVTPATAQQLSGLAAPNEVMIARKAGSTDAALINAINRVAPSGLPQSSADVLNADRDRALTQINAMNTVVAALAAVSCLVAAITAATTSAASLASRRRTWALLRCVGGSRLQVAALVASESLLFGLIGGLLGVAVGLGLARLAVPLVGLVPGLPQLRASSFTVPASSLVGPMIVALLLSAAGSVVPAWLAARIPPSAALKSTADLTKPTSRRTAAAGLLLIAAGAVVADRSAGHHAALTFAAVGALLIGFCLSITATLVVLAGVLSRRVLTIEVRLGLLDVVRRPRSAAIEAIAVTLAVGMVSLSWVALSSIQSATDARLGTSSEPDLVVGAVAGSAPVSAAALASLQRIPGVATAQSVPFGDGIEILGRGADGPVTLTTGTAAAAADNLQAASAGRFQLTRIGDDTVYIPQSPFPPFYPNSLVTLRGPGGTVHGLRVRYVTGLDLPSVISPATMARVDHAPLIREVWMALDKGADRARVVDTVTGIAIVNGQLPVSGPTILDIRTAGAFATAKAAAVAILAIAVLVAVIGAAATSALAIAERARVHATLRALGLERVNLGRMLAGRIIFVGTAAAIMGVTIGTLIGATCAAAVAHSLGLPPTFAFPALPIAIVVVVTVAAVRITALLPIERASYIPPSRALSEA